VSDTHPLWRPYDPPTPEEIARARVAPVEAAVVEVVAPDPAWPEAFQHLRRSLVEVLGERALAIEHVGSTSVPGLWAKPLIDVDLTVADSGDEAAYLPDLEAAGFELRVREPEWEEHRCLRGAAPAANVHVWSPGAVEPRRTAAFRDWLRTHADDRDAYAALKRDLATRGFTDVMDYNNQKAALIYDIYERIFAADPAHPHTPRPRPELQA
jgi:GrpB-like predicted nucleotidyltransferase (UPF0157 family)